MSTYLARYTTKQVETNKLATACHTGGGAQENDHHHVASVCQRKAIDGVSSELPEPKEIKKRTHVED